MRGEHMPAQQTGHAYRGSSPHARGALVLRSLRGVTLGIIPACAGSTRACCSTGRTSGDHPRMRGEHGLRVTGSPSREGSSPHARGALPQAAAHAQVEGIIPACAGSTNVDGESTAKAGDHPRMRGEHCVGSCCMWAIKGSSPHARGAPRPNAYDSCGRGIIPACAGSTLCSCAAGRKYGDHPRMRGEHEAADFEYQVSEGSSPHARGALVARLVAHHGVGIIPACAGSTGCASAPAASSRDHPRMRGEHSVRWQDQFAREGSSPHARGAPGVVVIPPAVAGIIPACAGSTRRRTLRASDRQDHPRMRGEHGGAMWVNAGDPGSSPHARGARQSFAASLAVRGIIPACAGSTPSLPNDYQANWDHPRMRGEHTVRVVRPTLSRGSSPHARGARHVGCGRQIDVGIIPACAGSTH